MAHTPRTSPAHDFVPEALIPSLPYIHVAQDERFSGFDPMLYLKLFTPDGRRTWYVAGYDRGTRFAYGLVIGAEREWGSFHIPELEAVRGPLGLPVERDLHFEPCFEGDLK